MDSHRKTRSPKIFKNLNLCLANFNFQLFFNITYLEILNSDLGSFCLEENS